MTDAGVVTRVDVVKATFVTTCTIAEDTRASLRWGPGGIVTR